MFAIIGIPNLVSVAIVVGAVSLLFRSRVFGSNQQGEISWLDAWLKAIVILVAIAFFSVFLPSYVMQTSRVTAFDRTVQQLIGASVWVVAFSATLFALWYAHREKRV